MAKPLSPHATELAGHYFLYGAMEMGSEILLHDNGSFEAALSYGGLDVLTKGSWEADDNYVTLHVKKALAEDSPEQIFNGLLLTRRDSCLVVDFGSGPACYKRPKQNASTSSAGH
jgi:hypothetical protein